MFKFGLYQEVGTSMIELVSLKEQEKTRVIPLYLSHVKTQQEGNCTMVMYKTFIHLVIHMTKHVFHI